MEDYFPDSSVSTCQDKPQSGQGPFCFEFIRNFISLLNLDC